MCRDSTGFYQWPRLMQQPADNLPVADSEERVPPDHLRLQFLKCAVVLPPEKPQRFHQHDGRVDVLYLANHLAAGKPLIDCLAGPVDLQLFPLAFR